MVSNVSAIAGVQAPIAQSIAQRLRARGNRVVLVGDISESNPARKADDVDTVACRLSDRPAIESALADIQDRIGPLEHLVIGSATPGRLASLSAATRADWAKEVEAPLITAFHLCQAVMPRLMARKRGSLLFVLSDYAIVGLRDGTPFAAGQTALYSFAKGVAREFAPMGIRVNCVGTGWSPATEGIPLGRQTEPDDVAAAADYLLSDRASYVTAQLLQPNGGRVMW